MRARPHLLTPRAAPWWASAIMLVVGALLVARAAASADPCAGPPPERDSSSAGRVVEGSFYSHAIRGCERYAIYLPRGYGSTGRRYPVIYALHGLPSDADGYREMDIDGWGQDASAVHRSAIVVAPQGARAADSDPEWHDWGAGRDWETLVARELVDHVDDTFRTIPGRRGRALIGVSAGGYGASIIGLRHPRRFGVIQSWSGYFHATNPDGDAPLELGSPEADRAASVHSYVAVARRAFRDQPFAFGFYVGDADPRFAPENARLHRELLAARVPHAYAVYPGAHAESFWREHEEQWVRTAVEHLSGA